MQLQTCHFCGHTVKLVHVHGHYQCSICHTNTMPCCDGDNYDTNLFLSDTTVRNQSAKMSSDNSIVVHGGEILPADFIRG